MIKYFMKRGRLESSTMKSVKVDSSEIPIWYLLKYLQIKEAIKCRHYFPLGLTTNWIRLNSLNHILMDKNSGFEVKEFFSVLRENTDRGPSKSKCLFWGKIQSNWIEIFLITSGARLCCWDRNALHSAIYRASQWRCIPEKSAQFGQIKGLTSVWPQASPHSQSQLEQVLSLNSSIQPRIWKGIWMIHFLPPRPRTLIANSLRIVQKIIRADIDCFQHLHHEHERLQTCCNHGMKWKHFHWQKRRL